METPNLDYINLEIKKLAKLLENPEPGLVSWCLMYKETMVNIVSFWNDDKPEPPKDWTAKDGRSNSSDRYLCIVDRVAKMLTNLRLGCNLEIEARCIVSTLAHKERLAPKEKE